MELIVQLREAFERPHLDAFLELLDPDHPDRESALASAGVEP